MHGHAAAQVVFFLVIIGAVGDAYPFVGGGDAAAVVGDVFAGLVLQAEEAADVVENSKVVRPVNNQRGFVVASRQSFCRVDKIVV